MESPKGAKKLGIMATVSGMLAQIKTYFCEI